VIEDPLPKKGGSGLGLGSKLRSMVSQAKKEGVALKENVKKSVGGSGGASPETGADRPKRTRNVRNKDGSTWARDDGGGVDTAGRGE